MQDTLNDKGMRSMLNLECAALFGLGSTVGLADKDIWPVRWWSNFNVGRVGEIL